jgi:hypothetical protein
MPNLSHSRYWRADQPGEMKWKLLWQWRKKLHRDREVSVDPKPLELCYIQCDWEQQLVDEN